MLLIGGTELNISLSSGYAPTISTSVGQVVVSTGPTGGMLTRTPFLGVVNASVIQSIVITGDDDVNAINLGSVLAADYAALTSIVVDAGNGDDSLTASPDFADSLFGGDGDDSILGQGGFDTFSGGDGKDSIDGGTSGDGEDLVDVQGGTDTVAGNQGLDSILDPPAEINEAFTLSDELLTILKAV